MTVKHLNTNQFTMLQQPCDACTSRRHFFCQKRKTALPTIFAPTGQLTPHRHHYPSPPTRFTLTATATICSALQSRGNQGNTDESEGRNATGHEGVRTSRVTTQPKSGVAGTNKAVRGGKQCTGRGTWFGTRADLQPKRGFPSALNYPTREGIARRISRSI